MILAAHRAIPYPIPEHPAFSLSSASNAFRGHQSHSVPQHRPHSLTLRKSSLPPLPRNAVWLSASDASVQVWWLATQADAPVPALYYRITTASTPQSLRSWIRPSGTSRLLSSRSRFASLKLGTLRSTAQLAHALIRLTKLHVLQIIVTCNYAARERVGTHRTLIFVARNSLCGSLAESSCFLPIFSYEVGLICYFRALLLMPCYMSSS
jgi:hypothetical protein